MVKYKYKTKFVTKLIFLNACILRSLIENIKTRKHL